MYTQSAQKCCAFLSISFAQTFAPYILQKYTFVFKIKNKFDFLIILEWDFVSKDSHVGTSSLLRMTWREGLLRLWRAWGYVVRVSH